MGIAIANGLMQHNDATVMRSGVSAPRPLRRKTHLQEGFRREVLREPLWVGTRAPFLRFKGD